jgi:hypothetical protein
VSATDKAIEVGPTGASSNRYLDIEGPGDPEQRSLWDPLEMSAFDPGDGRGVQPDPSRDVQLTPASADAYGSKARTEVLELIHRASVAKGTPPRIIRRLSAAHLARWAAGRAAPNGRD